MVMYLVHNSILAFFTALPTIFVENSTRKYITFLNSILRFLRSRKVTGAPSAQPLASSNFSLTNGDKFGA